MCSNGKQINIDANPECTLYLYRRIQFTSQLGFTVYAMLNDVANWIVGVFVVFLILILADSEVPRRDHSIDCDTHRKTRSEMSLKQFTASSI